MRKYSLILLVVLLVFALALGAVACGSSSSSKTPQELLTAAVTAGKAAASQSGTYEIDLTVKTDATSQDAAMMQAFLGQPIKVTGTFASQESPARADLSLAVSLMGTSLGGAVRAVDDNAWLNVLGQWYEVPAEQLQQASGGSGADVAKTVRDAMDEQGIDVNTWIKDLKAAGEETLTDTEVTHLTGTLDVQKMATDLVGLLQSPKIAELMATAGAEAGSETGVAVPDAAEIAELQATLKQMIKTATIDLWIAKSDSTMRKIALNADVAIPADLGVSGLSGATALFTINLDAPGKAITVAAPESAKPFADLETDLQNNPLLSGLLGGLSGSGSGLGGLLGQ